MQHDGSKTRPISVTIPEDVLSALRERAEAEKRSVSKTISMLLEEALGVERPKQMPLLKPVKKTKLRRG